MAARESGSGSKLGKESGSKLDKDGSAKLDHRMLAVVFVSLLLDLLAFTMILPLLPALLDYYGEHDTGTLYATLRSGISTFRDLIGAPDTPRWNSVLFGGALGSLFSFLQFISSPLMGALSDRYGRRPLMLLSMCGIAVSYMVWALSHSFALFVISRIIGGISKGNVSLATAVMTDISPPARRGVAMATLGMCFSIGFILGPLIGAFFSHLTRSSEGEYVSTPAYFALLLATIDIAFMFSFFKETLPQRQRHGSLISQLSEALDLILPTRLFNFKAVKGALAKDLISMKQLGSIYFLFLFLYSGLEFTLTFLAHQRFQFDSMQQGKMFFIIGLVMILVQGGYVRRIKPGNELKTALYGLISIIPAFILIGFAYRLYIFYTGLVLFSFGSATVVPSLTTVVSSYGSADQKGTVLGVFRSLGALARALGPVVASTVYWSLGPLACYTIGAVGLAAPLMLLLRHRKGAKKLE